MKCADLTTHAFTSFVFFRDLNKGTFHKMCLFFMLSESNCHFFPFLFTFLVHTHLSSPLQAALDVVRHTLFWLKTCSAKNTHHTLDTLRWPPGDSYINNLFLAATHLQIRMKMTDKDNEQSKYWRTDQKNDNCPIITHKLHNIKIRRVTRQQNLWVLDVKHFFPQHIFDMEV